MADPVRKYSTNPDSAARRYTANGLPMTKAEARDIPPCRACGGRDYTLRRRGERIVRKCLECARVYDRRYRATPKGREITRAYNATPERLKARRDYMRRRRAAERRQT